MFSQLKRLLADSLAFSVTTLGNRFVSYLLVPIYSYYLSREAFADWGQVNIITLFLTYICILGTDSALAYYYFEAKDERLRRSYMSSAVVFSAVCCTLLTALAFLFDYGLSQLIFDNSAGKELILPVACLSTVFAIILQHLLAYVRYERRVRLFVCFSVAYVAGTNCLSALFVTFTPTVLQLFYGQLIGQSLVCLILLVVLRKTVTWQISSKHLIEMIKYGAPLLPSLLSFWVLTAGPRTLLYHLVGVSQAATLEAVIRVASFINLLTAPFFLAWRPFSMSIKERKDAPDIFGLVAKLFLVIGAIVIMIMQFNMKFLINLYIPKYLDAYVYVWTLAFAVLLNVLHSIFGVGLLISKKTKIISLGFMLVSPLSLVLAVCLIPLYHIWGAVSATLCSYLLIITWIINRNQKFWPIKIEAVKIISYMFLYTLCMSVVSFAQYFDLTNLWFYYLSATIIVFTMSLGLVSVKQIKALLQMFKQLITKTAKQN